MNPLLATLGLGAALSLGLAACGGDSYEISDQSLQGKVGGVDWSFAGGETDSFLSDEESFFASLFSSSLEACAFSSPGGNRLLMAIPTEPGDYELGISQTMTFVVDQSDGLENLVATEGRLVVDEVTATTIAGGIYARFDGDNEIDGNFSLTICSD